MPNTSLQNLPEDILIDIARNLLTFDVQNLAATCRSCRTACSAKTLWLHVLRRDVYSQYLPTPPYSQPLDSLSGTQCKALATHSARLRKALCNSDPKTLTVVSLHGPRSVTWVRLIQGRWLLVACSDRTTSVLRLWEVSSFYFGPESGREPICEFFLPAPVQTGLMDVWDGEIFVALELRAQLSTSTMLLKIVDSQGSLAFAHLATYDKVSHIRAMCGPWLGFALFQEFSLPVVANWVTGEVFFLANVPNVKGGTLAMTINIDYGIIATISPDKVRLFSLVGDAVYGSREIGPLLNFELTVPVGTADIRFIEPPAGLASAGPEVRFAVAGAGGIYLYGIPVGRSGLLADRGAYLLWRQAARIEENILPIHPTIEPNGMISWLEGNSLSGESSRPISFHTLSHRPVVPFPSESNSPPPQSPSVYTLVHPELPALYAVGVYDFDAGLGFAAFGNCFGELAFFDLSGSTASNIAAVQSCFSPLVPSPTQGAPILPKTPILASFGPPFPYMDSHKTFSDEFRDKTFTHWKSFPCFPAQLPPQWDDNVFHSDSWFPDPYWTNFIHRRPRSSYDRPWRFERAHFYGTLVPLMDHPQHNIEISQAGGLLFLTWEHLIDETFVVHPGPSVEQLALAVNAGQLPPHERIYRDPSANVEWTNKNYLWDWELEQGRNRWAEMKQRGGDVDLSLVNAVPWRPPLLLPIDFGEEGSPIVSHPRH